MSRSGRTTVILAAVLLGGLVHAGAVQAADGVAGSFNWQAIARALRGALSSWTFSPVPDPTATVAIPPSATFTRSPVPSATPSRVPQSPTRTASASVTATRTKTPTRTRTSTRTTTPTSTRTDTRTATATRTWTATPPPTSTRTFTGTRTSTRTATATRTASWTKVPSATPTPTRTTDPALFTPTRRTDGQIALGQAYGAPPAQKLASALVVFPYLVSTVALGGSQDTRVELVNMSTRDQTLQCFYVRLADCVEIGFYVTLTAEQPLAWFSSEGTSNPVTGTSVPPLDGTGELKCAVVPRPEDSSAAAQNVVQGRATVFDTKTGETTAYGAIGIQRLYPGGFGGVIDLGGDYESCPDRLHFHVMTSSSAVSDLVLITCDEDLLMQSPTTTAVQLAIVNEYEQVFSASMTFTCQTVRSFSRINVLSSYVLGTDTAHLIVRGVSSGLMGLVVERFDALGERQTAVSEPYLEGARYGTIVFP